MGVNPVAPGNGRGALDTSAFARQCYELWRGRTVAGEANAGLTDDAPAVANGAADRPRSDWGPDYATDPDWSDFPSGQRVIATGAGWPIVAGLVECFKRSA